ncbi:MAG: Crp/Fnr family transcriptional regulator [Dinghuibacter sp.]|nr:Crp/Fnr family transcriptional regulator [Dinghuibacter sp.]
MNKEALLQVTIEPLLNYFNNMIPLSSEERNWVTGLFKPRHYRKRHYVLQEGDICNQFNFVVRGCLRMYKIDDKGNTHIVQFSAENSWLMDMGSFHERISSEWNIDALEDTLVLQISYNDLIALYLQSPTFNRIFRVLTENNFVALQKRLLQCISSTAEERYRSFLQNYAHLNNRIPQTQIAAFLGVTPEFLSRLRKKQTQKS